LDRARFCEQATMSGEHAAVEGGEDKKSGRHTQFGGGGLPCTVCSKTVYPAETTQFEQKPYHSECFACNECKKNKLQVSDAAQFDGAIYCRSCFVRGGFAQKQTSVKWEAKTRGTSTSVTSRFGGGGNPCTDCAKTVYPAEAIQFDQKIYHAACFKCSKCNKNNLAPSDAAMFDAKVYCKMCFTREGFAQKQTAVKWESKGTGSSNTLASRFGGGGTNCIVCTKIVYPAETLQFEQRAYHHDCFACNKCQKKCTVQNAESFEGTVFCRMCFERDGLARKQTQTAKKGGGSGAYNPRFAQFGGGGNKCVNCQKVVYPAETLQFEGQAYHQKCFKCNNCSVEMEATGAEWSGDQKKAFCKKCFMQLGLHMANVRSGPAGGEEQSTA